MFDSYESTVRESLDSVRADLQAQHDGGGGGGGKDLT